LKLQRIQIRNYGNLKDVTLKGLANLNILIGPTNCGKTHILKAIEKLNFISETRSVRDREKFLKREGNLVEFQFQVNNSVLTLKEEQGILKIRGNLPGDVKNKPVLFCQEERLKTYRGVELKNYIISTLSDGKINKLIDILSSIDTKIMLEIKTNGHFLL